MKCTKNTSIFKHTNSFFVTDLCDAFSTKKKYTTLINPINPHFVTVRGRWLYSKKIARTCNTVVKKEKVANSELPDTNEALLRKLHPYYVSGFADGESSFTIVIRKNRLSKTGILKNIESKIQYFFRSIEPRFSIGLHEKDRGQLDLIQAYFEVGTITKAGKDSIKYRVSNIKGLTNAIIPHFDKYALITQKLADYLLLKQGLELIKHKKHLTPEGLQELVNIKASMNEGLSDELKTSFPDTIPVPRPLIRNQEIQDPNWLAGFTSAEGSFMIKTRKSSAYKGYSVILVFKLAQHRRDLELMTKLADYLDCGHYYPYLEAGDFTVTRISDITDKIIPFFDRYPIFWCKS